MSDEPIFEGFERPTRNYFPMPNEWIDICAQIDNLAELKVIQYVIRHTWGYKEYGITKAITVEEFMNGRKRNDGTRIDSGTGLKSDRSVKDGLKAAIKHGYLIFEVDATDLARIKKSYALKMSNSGQVDATPQDVTDEIRQVVSTPQTGSIYPSGVQNLPLGGANSTPRSEKDTIEKHLGNTPIEKQEVATSSEDRNAPANVYHFEEEKKRITNGRIPALTKGQDERYDTATDTTTSSNLLHSSRNSPSVDRDRLPVHDGFNSDFGDTEAQRHVEASHSHVDIGNEETVKMPAVKPSQHTPALGQRSLAVGPQTGSQDDSPNVQAPSSLPDAARAGQPPMTGAVQASSRDEKPPMALTAKQIEKQLAQRQDEILALYASKIGRKPSRSKANLDGALKLAQDDATDEDIGTTIDAILADSFLAKNLSLTFVHSKLDALARKPIPIENKQKAPARDQNIGVSGLPRLQVRKMNYGA